MSNVVKKVCKKCGEELPTTSFYTNRHNKDNLQSYCKDCQKKSVIERREREITKYKQEQIVLRERIESPLEREHIMNDEDNIKAQEFWLESLQNLEEQVKQQKDLCFNSYSCFHCKNDFSPEQHDSVGVYYRLQIDIGEERNFCMKCANHLVDITQHKVCLLCYELKSTDKFTRKYEDTYDSYCNDCNKLKKQFKSVFGFTNVALIRLFLYYKKFFDNDDKPFDLDIFHLMMSRCRECGQKHNFIKGDFTLFIGVNDGVFRLSGYYCDNCLEEDKQEIFKYELVDEHLISPFNLLSNVSSITPRKDLYNTYCLWIYRLLSLKLYCEKLNNKTFYEWSKKYEKYLLGITDFATSDSEGLATELDD